MEKWRWSSPEGAPLSYFLPVLGIVSDIQLSVPTLNYFHTRRFLWQPNRLPRHQIPSYAVLLRNIYLRSYPTEPVTLKSQVTWSPVISPSQPKSPCVTITECCTCIRTCICTRTKISAAAKDPLLSPEGNTPSLSGLQVPYTRIKEQSPIAVAAERTREATVWNQQDEDITQAQSRGLSSSTEVKSNHQAPSRTNQRPNEPEPGNQPHCHVTWPTCTYTNIYIVLDNHTCSILISLQLRTKEQLLLWSAPGVCYKLITAFKQLLTKIQL